jgi:hypothetical protein
MPFFGVVPPGVAMDGDVSTEQGVGKMMHALVPAGHLYMLATESIAGWDPPGFQTVDGVGFYLTAPFTGAAAYLPAPPVNTWQQNSTGVAVQLGIMAAIVGSQGTNGHMYLLTSPDGTNSIIRHDFLALRTGAAGS